MLDPMYLTPSNPNMMLCVWFRFCFQTSDPPRGEQNFNCESRNTKAITWRYSSINNIIYESTLILLRENHS
jgi:hypothetical protein